MKFSTAFFIVVITFYVRTYQQITCWKKLFNFLFSRGFLNICWLFWHNGTSSYKNKKNQDKPGNKSYIISVFGTLVNSCVSLFTLIKEVFPVDVLKKKIRCRLAFLEKIWIRYKCHNKNTSFIRKSLNSSRGFYIRWIYVYFNFSKFH